MIRSIIDVPLPLVRLSSIDWRVDWRGQPAATGTDASEQVVLNRFPRFVGAPPMVLPPDMIGEWRALVARAQGRVNAWRIPMLDPVVMPVRCSDWQTDWSAWRAGLYVEPRPVVSCASGAAAGATSITVDERLADRPIQVGQFLSHDDWPFVVTGRSGRGATAVLQVQMLRKPIPSGADIDLIARGIFVGTTDAMGWPVYGLDRVARPSLDLQEWITR